MLIAEKILLLLLLCATCTRLSAQEQNIEALREQERKAYLERRYTDAMDFCRKRVDYGDASAMCSMAMYYLDGQGVEPDSVIAFLWYLKAADKGNSSGMYHVAQMYGKGHGVEQDSSEYLSWMKRAAGEGINDAMYTLGMMEWERRNCTEAIQYFLKAAEQYHRKSMTQLGYVYSRGSSCLVQDLPKAIHWYTVALDNTNDPDAFEHKDVVMHDLARSYEASGDDLAALDWYRKSYAAGYKDAKYRIAWFYEQGKGVKKNRKLAKEWESK